MSDESTQVGVSWSFYTKFFGAEIINGLVVDHEGTVGVLQGGVGGQDRVVGLNNGGRDLQFVGVGGKENAVLKCQWTDFYAISITVSDQSSCNLSPT